MRIVLISTPNKFKSEVEIVIELFQNGLEIFHLRKPKFSRRRLKNYIRMIPREYRDRIVLHSHFDLAVQYKLRGIHLSKQDRKGGFRFKLRLLWFRMKHKELLLSTSFHSILSLIEDNNNYAYVILSPIFDSAEDTQFSASFSRDQLKSAFGRSKHKVFALGGVIAERLEMLQVVGFQGAAVSGSIWDLKSEEEQIAAFRRIIDVADGRAPAVPRIDIKPVRIDLNPNLES